MGMELARVFRAAVAVVTRRQSVRAHLDVTVWHQIAAVYNHENPEMLGMSSMMGDFNMSSLVDNIILMNWVETGDAFRLGLTIAKMRANPTTRLTHECEILEGRGLRVLPRRLPVGVAHLPFSGYQGLISRSPTRRPAARTPGGHGETE